jgi:xanthine dehydrogenase molybdopterin-binding subunit B
MVAIAAHTPGIRGCGGSRGGFQLQAAAYAAIGALAADGARRGRLRKNRGGQTTNSQSSYSTKPDNPVFVFTDTSNGCTGA